MAKKSFEEEEAEREIARRLEQVAGARFEEDAGDPVRRWRNRLLKWMVAAAAAVGAVATVFYMLESHRLPPPAQAAPAKPAKPITVTIVPAKPP